MGVAVVGEIDVEGGVGGPGDVAGGVEDAGEAGAVVARIDLVDGGGGAGDGAGGGGHRPAGGRLGADGRRAGVSDRVNIARTPVTATAAPTLRLVNSADSAVLIAAALEANEAE